MADSKAEKQRKDPDAGREAVASQESKIRDAKVPDEKPSEATVAQVEELK